ncbi:hypothetical protein RJ641_022028, partial [Dillenia turbinata]
VSGTARVKVLLVLWQCCNGWEDQGEKLQLQKQYFEQRKRQQQHLQHQISGLENCADEACTFDQYHHTHRSLDVLCLQNLSTNSKETNSCCIHASEDLELGHSTLHQNIAKAPSIISGKVMHRTSTQFHESNVACMVDCAEVGTPPCHQVKNESPRKISLAASSSHSHTISQNRSKLEHNSTSPKHWLSVLDLLADDGQDDNSARVSAHEAHVAFSLAGLGEVGDETPAHSPQHPTRYPTVGWKCHSRAPTNESAWSALVKDHDKDTSSLLRHETVNNLSARKGTKGHGSELKRPVTLYREVQSVFPAENRERSSTTFLRTSNLSKLTPTKFLELTCPRQMKPLDNSSYEAEFSKVDKDLDFNYFLKIKDIGYAEAEGRTETEDLFAQFPNPKLHGKTESSSLRSKGDSKVGNCSFNGCFSGKYAFDQPFGIGKSCISPVFSKKGSEKDNLEVTMVPELLLHVKMQKEPSLNCSQIGMT